jgi:hypothetical protein
MWLPIFSSAARVFCGPNDEDQQPTFAQTDEAGARPTLFAATQDLPGASYVGPDGLSPWARGYPALVGRTAAASDVEMAKRLWMVSEDLTGAKFPLQSMP